MDIVGTNELLINIPYICFVVIILKEILVLDKSTFKLLFQTHYSTLCNIAFRIVGDLDTAEDIVQDVFVKIWNEKPGLDSNKNISGYIYIMVKNHALEIYRRNGISTRIMNELIPPSAFEQPVLYEDEEIEKSQLIDKIYVSIRQLPPKCGQVFTLNKVNGLTYTQIADQLNISVKTVDNHMAKALKLLREMIYKKNI